jgi:hypothetical protein
MHRGKRASLHMYYAPVKLTQNKVINVCVVFFFFFFFLDKVSLFNSVAQVDLELEILLPLPLEGWGYRYALPCLAKLINNLRIVF